MPIYILKNNPELEAITYLDSDVYCFSDPQPIFDALGRNSILITPHRFPQHLKDRERYGIYNVGVVTFRNDPRGLQCLHWWRERCLEWCYDRLEGSRFGDQGYLNDWPERFEGVVVLDHKGVNTAPWNWMSCTLSTSDHGTFIDDDPLIFYHFHQLKQLNGWICDPGLSSYGGASRSLRRLIYAPYLRELKDTWRWLRRRAPEAGPGYTRCATKRESASKLVKDVVRSTVRGQLILTPGRTVI